MTKAEWIVSGFKVISYGNGHAYSVERGGLEAFFQGDDAAAWRSDYDAAEVLNRLSLFLGETMRYHGQPNAESLLASAERLEEASRIAGYEPAEWEDSDE